MNIFVDSSVLIEFEKQTRPQLFLALQNSEHSLYINTIVVSEYLYKLLAIIAQKSPMSVCESKKVRETIEQQDAVGFLAQFEYLPVPVEALPLSIELMKKYNLLPNDALILASCILQGIKVLASHDSDFGAACQAENMLFLNDETNVMKLHD
ncbi:MAG: PIN domain-containing protein [Bacteroidetes bacterium]|nr:MAG: PIN domain-containing protein [Bacteroidota bacterium]